ncbi:MAG: hypothetical protein DRR08_04450 [Candidatus Parabeggiatoa sp. nov. 2]|nr:MAG: hypothetical protein B6247_28065 [Beggiatoa sp. 4572_84]RKZ63091.1 MAG: hypothetical protein DRR08_04450 [Gammaproteobacteria bacterium]
MQSIRLRLFSLLSLGFVILANGQAYATIDDATEIEVGTEYSDAISTADEVDWFRFNLPADGNVVVSLKHEQFSESNAIHWNVYLYSGADTASPLGSTSIRATARDGSFSLGLGAGTYFVKVTPQYNARYDTTWWDDPYFLAVNFEESHYYEKSPNHNPNWATPIDLNREYSANLAFNTDVDYFTFDFPAEGKVSLTFRHQELTTSNSIYWNVHLYDQADIETARQSIIIKGTQLEVSSDEFVLTPGTYIIKVTPNINRYDNVTTWWNDQYFLKVETDVEACAPITTYGKNPISGHWSVFQTPCDVPEGWTTQTTRPEPCPLCPGGTECIDNPASCGLYKLAELEAATNAGRQECINDPASCALITQAELDAQTKKVHETAKTVGRQECKDNPDSCDLHSPSELEEEIKKASETGKTAGRQECKNDPDSCGLITQAKLDAQTKAARETGKTAGRQECKDKPDSCGLHTKAELDTKTKAARESGKTAGQQECKNDPSSCGLITQAKLDAQTKAASETGKTAGRQECKNDPASCGLHSPADLATKIKEATEKGKTAGQQECKDKPDSCDLHSPAELEAAIKAGRQECIDDPDSCDLHSPDELAAKIKEATEKAKTAGQQDCKNDPASCDLHSPDQLENAIETAKIECFNDPASCDIQVTGDPKALTLTGGGYYEVGDKLVVKLKENIEVSNRFKRVDLWVVIKMPNGSLLYRNNDIINMYVTEPTPFKRSIEHSKVIHHILALEEVPPNLGGNYTVYAFYNQEGAGLDDLFQTLRFNISSITVTLSNK